MADDAPIVLLRSDVIEQIAAGEVIDRPASVVKELVENAIDAGARRVAVSLERGGVELIEVADDGRGMSAAQAEVALERHATSKLRAVDDLLRMGTLGFRGEGLSSVAAVSQLELTTRRPQESSGVSLRVRAGRIVDRAPVGAAPGTRIAARELFFNVPARRKFLKSTATEAGHAVDVIQRLACAFFGVHFILRHEGRTTLDLPAASDRAARARRLLGRRGRRVHTARAAAAGVRIEVCLADPEQALSSARTLTVLANHRAVRDRELINAVLSGCGTRLPARRYPAGVIHIDVDPQEIDVNVHPQKTEVRFARPEVIFDALRDTVRRAISGGEPARVYAMAAPAASSGAGRLTYRDQRERIREATRRFFGGRGRASDGPTDYGLGAALARADRRAHARSSAFAQPPAERNGAGRASASSAERAAAPRPGRSDAPAAARTAAEVTLVGRTRGGILVCERAGQLVLVDELASWRELARRRLTPLPLARSALAEPVTCAFDDQRTSAVVEGLREPLGRLGFALEPFGGQRWVVREVPVALGPRAMAAAGWAGLLDELVDVLAAPPSGSPAGLDRALSRLAERLARERSGRGRPEQLLAELSELDPSTWLQRAELQLARERVERPLGVELTGWPADREGRTVFGERGDGDG